MTIEIALIYISQTLERVSDAPRLDAERLLLCVVGKQESSWLYAHSEQELTEKQKNQMSRLVARRQSGEPLAYILGHQEFYGRDFIVTKDVLIPRSATEDLIDRALEVIEDMTREKKRPLVIADIGTGSGCIVVTLLLESSPVAKAMGDKGIKNHPPSLKLWGTRELRVVATDISAAALAVARRNAERYNVADTIKFRQGDMLTPLASNEVDLIVSNPPYVPTEELLKTNTIETRGLKFEPQLALDGGRYGQKYTDQIKTSGIPAVVEVTGGKIQTLNL